MDQVTCLQNTGGKNKNEQTGQCSVKYCETYVMFMLLLTFKRSFFSAKKCALPEQLEYVFVLWSFVCGIFFCRLLLNDGYSFDKLLSFLLIKLRNVKLVSLENYFY